MTACKTTAVTLSDVDPCGWVDPIEFSDPTKEWLSGLDWPPTAFEDFDKIGDHNDKVEEICGP